MLYQLISNGAVLGTFRTKEEAEREARKREEAIAIFTSFVYFPYEIKEVNYQLWE